MHQHLLAEPQGLKFSSSLLLENERRNLNRLLSAASSLVSRPGRSSLSPAQLKSAAEAAASQDGIVRTFKQDGVATLLLMWGTPARCAALLQLHALALRAMTESYEIDSALGAKSKLQYALLFQCLTSLLAVLLEMCGGRCPTMRSAAFSAMSLAVQMDTLPACSHLLAAAGTRLPPSTLMALARLPSAFLRAVIVLTKHGPCTRAKQSAANLQQQQRQQGPPSAAAARPLPLSAEEVMEAVVRSGVMEQAARTLVFAALHAKSHSVGYGSGSGSAGGSGSGSAGGSGFGSAGGSGSGVGGKRGGGGGGSRRGKAAAAAAPAAATKTSADDRVQATSRYPVAFVSSAAPLLQQLLECRRRSGAACRTVADCARAILSGPCFQYIIAAHVVAQLVAADGETSYGLAEANMLPYRPADVDDAAEAAGWVAAVDQRRLMNHHGMCAAARMWYDCRKTSPQVPLAPCGRDAVHAMSMRMLRLAVASGAAHCDVAAAAAGGGAATAATARGGAAALVVSRTAATELGMEALRSAAVTCHRPPVLFGCAKQHGGSSAAGGGGGSAAAAEWWSAAVPMVHLVLTQTEEKQLQDKPLDLLDIFSVVTDCWPAGDLPPSPPPNLSAALDAGIVPLLERTMRVKQRLYDDPANASMLLTCSGSWPVLGRLLAYSPPTQAAAFIVTSGKLMRRLITPGAASDYAKWVTVAGKESCGLVVGNVTERIIRPMVCWLRSYAGVLAARQDPAAVRTAAVRASGNGTTRVKLYTAEERGVQVTCDCVACDGSFCFFGAAGSDSGSGGGGGTTGREQDSSAGGSGTGGAGGGGGSSCGGDRDDAADEEPYLHWEAGPSAQLLQLIVFAAQQWLPALSSLAFADTAAAPAAAAAAASPVTAATALPSAPLDDLFLSAQLRAIDGILAWIPILVSAHAVSSNRLVSPFELAFVQFLAGTGAANGAAAGAAARWRLLLLHDLQLLKLLGLALRRLVVVRGGGPAVEALGECDASNILDRVCLALECMAAEFPGEVAEALRDGTLPRMGTEIPLSANHGLLPPATLAESSSKLRAHVFGRLQQLQQLEPSVATFWRVPLNMMSFWIEEMRLAELGSMVMMAGLALKPSPLAGGGGAAAATSTAAPQAAASGGGLLVLRTCSNPGCVNLDGASEEALPRRACGQCARVSYCGQECQRAHWRAGHKKDCGASRESGGGGAGGSGGGGNGGGGNGGGGSGGGGGGGRAAGGSGGGARAEAGAAGQQGARKRAVEYWWQ